MDIIKYIIGYVFITALIVGLIAVFFMAIAAAFYGFFAIIWGSVSGLLWMFRKPKKPTHVCQMCWSVESFDDPTSATYGCGFCNSELAAQSFYIPADVFFQNNSESDLEEKIVEQIVKIKDVSKETYPNHRAATHAKFHRKNGLKRLNNLLKISRRYYPGKP
ncbi:MAG: hypothetical protein COW24_03155 [Candidatus Kerfeldbacteria bacterium CG15_BIG_FIL_POST_REV_8_21_14_020_45_12]|uniref:Uncharacterized protein n=1 Tax=Candidatus Kerfeldbacteria bacterium CG15_BIG_FIL_POST_REV_8_21_14_020_45_12 TaxID=2014247 RepID=A0A2M7H3W7_9BACT|nr:MAG: hypothetical protein COW24_03155 [Candidatus Kerfeldbacteria bacterium CG15_BIG_FIL_POST_REV_8_21_14_020_45_12]PJA92770.1 MAG: hypothetical protein CO132_06295 [Candidatus Kerfeldbacteria bacterium CG_4_9_14_3_um_filter_45_8]